MRVRRLEITNFRRIREADLALEPAAFLVGQNNTGKSSAIAALEALLSLESEKLTQSDILEEQDGGRAEGTTITGYICDIPADVAASRGFKGRVIDGEFVYRKSLSADSSKPKLQTREFPFTVKEAFADCKTVGDVLDAGIPVEDVKDALKTDDRDQKLKKGWERDLPDALDFDTNAEPVWVDNPGGFPAIVLSRLPRLIHVPAITDSKEIDTNGILGECLGLLFEDLVQENPVAQTIQKNLDALERQMDPNDDQSLVCGMLKEVNAVVGDVFPECGIAVAPSLQGVLQVLKPKYEVSVYSNVKTAAKLQGTGLLRTCIFAMLRHHARLKIEKELQTRPIIVAFEEPELFLHPAAANMLRDTIYELGESDQIVCSTHSPWMIDLSRDPQSLSRMYLEEDGSASAYNYGVSSTLGQLPDDDKQRVKMLQVFDDELSRVFFSECAVIVEGDSEMLAIRATIALLPQDAQKRLHARFQIAKARGKASIVSLVKYLEALGISPRVVHDGDFGTEGAEVFNQPIADALNNPDHLVVLDKNLEEALGYVATSGDKPFKAYTKVRSWGSAADVPVQWRDALVKTFDIEWP